MSRLTIVHGFGDNNLGGAAITRATIQLCRELDATGSVSLVAVTDTKRFDYTRHTEPQLDILPPPFSPRTLVGKFLALLASLLLLVSPKLALWQNPTLKQLRTSDYVVAKGGYVYRDRVNLSGLLSGWFTMWPFIYANRCGAVGIVYSASIGPWDGRLSRLLSRLSLGRADIICPRDEDSAQRLSTDIKTRAVVSPMPDCVFGLADDLAMVRRTGTPIERGNLLLVPRRLPNNQSYWNWFINASRRLVSDFPDLEPLLLAQDAKDMAAVRDLAHSLSLDPSAIVDVRSPDEAVNVYQRSALCFTSRMHGAILASLAGSPSLLIDVDPGKSKPIFHGLGLDWTVIPEGLELEQLSELATRSRALLDGDSLSESVARVAAQVRTHRLHTAQLANRLYMARSRR